MFKNIFSKVQAFGKAVFTRIVGFIGGVIGIKPETVEVPAPPEIANDSLNNAPEKAKAEEEKGLTKAYTAVKKAASAAIKAGKQALIVSAQLAYMVAHFAVPFQILSLAWEYAQAQGLVAIFMGLWNMGTLPYFILCMAIVIGIGTLMITVETLWSTILYPVRRFLFPVKKHKVQVTNTVEILNQQLVNIENRLKGIETNSGDIEISVEKETASFLANVVKQSVEQAEKRLNDRLTNLEKAIATPTPTINLEKEEIVVDSSPAITLEPVVSEVIPTVIEIEEVVDSSPTPTRKDELMEQKISELKEKIRDLNKALPAPKRISARGEKIALVARIIRAEAELAA